MSSRSGLSLLDALDQSLAPETNNEAQPDANTNDFDDTAFASQTSDIRGHLNGGESSKSANNLNKQQEIQRLNAGTCRSPSPHHVTKIRVYS